MSNIINGIRAVIKGLLFILTKRQKVLAGILIALTIFNASIQTMCIAVISVLVNILTNPTSFMNGTLGQWLILVVGDSRSIGEYIAGVCLIVGLLYVVKEVFCVFYIWYSTTYSLNIERELSKRVFSSYLKRNYDFFLNYGTSKMMRDIDEDAMQVNCLIRCLVTVFVESITVFFILVYIFVTYWQIAFCMGGLAVLCALLLFKWLKNWMNLSGIENRKQLAETRKVLMDVIGGIKEVQVMRKQKYFLDVFNKQKLLQQKPKKEELIASNIPTYAIEGIFVVGLALFMGISALNNDDFSSMLPVLAATMVAGVRILPSMGRISSAINYIPFYRPSLESVYNNLKAIADYDENHPYVEKEEKTEVKKFVSELHLDHIRWKYEDSDHYIIDNLNLKIKKGESIGIVGHSGAGKSTLADIILGLHVPNEGRVLLDGTDIANIPYSYSSIVGYVSQSLYLFEGTIRENVAFGVDPKDIDEDKIWAALNQAQLDDYVRDQGLGLDSIIGERGVKISGGQRQRLAIARALYREPQILVLDEATSALDAETEATFMHEIESLYGTITMVIIAHRLTTISKCDKIYEIKDGKAVLRKWEEL